MKRSKSSSNNLAIQNKLKKDKSIPSELIHGMHSNKNFLTSSQDSFGKTLKSEEFSLKKAYNTISNQASKTHT
jgi:lipopolysaccharide biosynthesis glycosyltransferase